MEQERPPPEYASHDPRSFALPDVPQTLPSKHESLDAVTSSYHPEAQKPYLSTETQLLPTSSSRTMALHQQPVVETMSPRSTMSIDDAPYRAPSVSMDDPDVRIAAEALSGLGNPDFMRSPSTRPNTAGVPLNRTGSSPTSIQQSEEEPLLTLLAETHPWLGTTINGSLTAYTTTKSYSPRFIQNSADFMERNIGTPLSSTVGSVGRRTGVEGGLRRYLGSRQASEADREGSNTSLSNKRRRILDKPRDFDVEQGWSDANILKGSSRRESQSTNGEPLPAYDDNRAPMYDERGVDTELAPSQQAKQNHGWRTQLVISTSGLGAALSEKSLNSLKYCLSMLRGATERVGSLMKALRIVLEDYEKWSSGQQNSDPEKAAYANEKAPVTEQQSSKDQEAQVIADRIKSLSDDIWNTLKTVVNNISRYTGGALPDNAGRLVRSQLMSVPQRWRIATQSTAQSSPQAEDETSRSANRMLAFAKEGIDMMAQVSTILANVVLNAEQWLDSFGRKKDNQSAPQSQAQTPTPIIGDFNDKDMVDAPGSTIQPTIEGDKRSSL